MQASGSRPNFHARTALASTLGPSWPETPTRDPDEELSDDSQEEEEQLEPYQQIEYQRVKTQRLVPPAPATKPDWARPPGHLAPPLKQGHTRPPGGHFPPSTPLPALPLRHPSEKPRYATDADPVRLHGLGWMGGLTDALVARLCSYVDRHSLLSLTATSRILYQLGNWDSRVWRSHALRRWCGDFIFRINWKLTTFYSNKGTDVPPPQLVQLLLVQRSMPPHLPIPAYAKPTTDHTVDIMQHQDNPYAALHAQLSGALGAPNAQKMKKAELSTAESVALNALAPIKAGASDIIDDGELGDAAFSGPKSAEELNPDLLDDGRPLCVYDEGCYRKNPAHFAQYRHPKWRAKQRAEQGSMESQASKDVATDGSRAPVETIPNGTPVGSGKMEAPLESGRMAEGPSMASNSGAEEVQEDFLRIPGFFSESMYKEWYLSQVDLDGWYFDTGTVPRIRASELTMETFRERFLKPGQPCIITDVVPTWPAMAKWHPDRLMDEYCETLIKINEYNDDDLRIKMTMRDYLIYMRENQEARPLYVFDSSFQRRAPGLLHDYGIPRYFWEDLFAALDEHHRPAFRWFLFGSARTGSPFHQDPNGTSAWNAVTHGHKRWALYPPYLSSPPGAYPNGHNPNSLKWWTLIYPQLPPELKPIEFIQGPGEIIFIPSGWWHAVLNLSETLSVTQNFVNLENLDSVVHSLFNSGMHGVMNYWRSRLLSLRPELYSYIGDRIAIEASVAQQDQLAELHNEMQESQSSFEKREAELLAEIERLSVAAGAANKPKTAASLTTQLIAAQRRGKKKSLASGSGAY